MALKDHKRNAPESVRCMIITVSDTRDKNTDKSGKLIKDFLEEHGHKVSSYIIVKDERELIEKALHKGIENEEVEVIVTNGGTGIAPRDVTIEAVESLIDKEISGFGELFRMLSYTEDIGSAALLSRAVAGVARKTAIFSTPGSSGAVNLAMRRLIIPEITHVAAELKKGH